MEFPVACVAARVWAVMLAWTFVVGLVWQQLGATDRVKGCSTVMRAFDDRTVALCAMTNDFPRLRHLIEVEKHDPLARNAHGMTPLHYAVIGGHIHIIHYLVRCKRSRASHGVDVADPLSVWDFFADAYRR